MTTWHNLPASHEAPLISVARLCPRGWFEVRVFQNPPMGVLHPGGTSFAVLKSWGLDIGDEELAKYLRNEDFAQVPHWATVLVRVEAGPGPGRGPRECDQCELKPVVDANQNDWTDSDVEGAICPLHYLDDGSCDGSIRTRIWGNASWGVDGKPVYAEQVPHTAQGPTLVWPLPAPAGHLEYLRTKAKEHIMRAVDDACAEVERQGVWAERDRNLAVLRGLLEGQGHTDVGRMLRTAIAKIEDIG